MQAHKPISANPWHQELRFWAMVCFAFALCLQALMPPAAMAYVAAQDGMSVWCSGESDTPTSDKQSPTQGLKCADCVVASVTTTLTPQLSQTKHIHVFHDVNYIRPEFYRLPPARAPPKPYACGPPSLI
jgi:hypothetical protein